VCRQQLGAVSGQGAVYLTPVLPDVVVYGSGDAQVRRLARISLPAPDLLAVINVMPAGCHQ
jgi:hypothetical protein